MQINSALTAPQESPFLFTTGLSRVPFLVVRVPVPFPELRGLQISSNTGVMHSAQQGSPLEAYTLVIAANGYV